VQIYSCLLRQVERPKKFSYHGYSANHDIGYQGCYRYVVQCHVDGHEEQGLEDEKAHLQICVYGGKTCKLIVYQVGIE